jgi:hypothetical protein
VIFLRVERGVSGYELESLGYKTTYLPKKARAAKAKAAITPKGRPQKKRKSRKQILEAKAAKKRRYQARLKERLGAERMREIWRAKRQRTRARKLAREAGRETSEMGDMLQALPPVVRRVPALRDGASGDDGMPEVPMPDAAKEKGASASAV